MAFGSFDAAILAMGMALVAFLVIIAIALWVYQSLAFMAIGRKAKLKYPGLAWIPAIGPMIIAYQASKMHWWPWLLWISIIFAFIPVLVFVYVICVLILAVYSIIWQWKMFEAVKRPGWWSLLCLIPIVNLVLWGIAAWGK